MEAVVECKVSVRKRSVKKVAAAEGRRVRLIKLMARLRHLVLRAFMSRPMVALTISVMASTWLASWLIMDTQLSMIWQPPTPAL